MNYFICLLKRFKHLSLSLFAFTIRKFCSIRKGSVICYSFGGKSYSCSPKYISEYILSHYPDNYEIDLILNKDVILKDLDKKIIRIENNSLRSIYIINTSEFIISNIRFYMVGYWKKRKGQKYIMTWHGATGIKPIEFDVPNLLPANYLNLARQDSESTDLMLSDSKWSYDLYRRAFRYNGEILKSGIPRNDIFYNKDLINNSKRKVFNLFKLQQNVKVVLYAPTFRVDKSIDKYIIHWRNIINSFEFMLKSSIVVLVRLHPAMIGVVDPSKMIVEENVFDATYYSDMQELLCASDVLITDYSSSMFEFSLMNRPCFLYAPDAEEYDRGFYFSLKDLPFTISKNEDELIKNIYNFDDNSYLHRLSTFCDKNIGNYNQKEGTKNTVDWIIQHSL